MYHGLRGLPGGSSLARLLFERRGVRNMRALPPLTEKQILAWADAYYLSTGHWPTKGPGSVPDIPGETWESVNRALYIGLRGLPGGSSLARLLHRKRGVPNPMSLPRLRRGQIIAWARAHRRRTGFWPRGDSGSVVEAPTETWKGINDALASGGRGLRNGSSSLAQLLAKRVGMRHRLKRPPLSIKQILSWADAYFACRGCWPHLHSGPVPEAVGETWSGINAALIQGTRGLPGGSSLSRLLAERREAGTRCCRRRPVIAVEQILSWADAHYARTGRWPNVKLGSILEGPDETWHNIDDALRRGCRGLPGGSSLFRLLAKKRGVRRRYSTLSDQGPPPSCRPAEQSHR